MIDTRAGLSLVWTWLAEVADPEIPVLSVVDLGIVRDVAWLVDDGAAVLKVTVTPTYSGCPATRVIERDIVRALHARGVQRVEIEQRLARLGPPRGCRTSAATSCALMEFRRPSVTATMSSTSPRRSSRASLVRVVRLRTSR